MKYGSVLPRPRVEGDFPNDNNNDERLPWVSTVVLNSIANTTVINELRAEVGHLDRGTTSKCKFTRAHVVDTFAESSILYIGFVRRRATHRIQ